MFKYTVSYKLSDERSAQTTIKTDDNFDLNNKTQIDYFIYAYNLVQSIERIFGVGSVRVVSIVNKIEVLPWSVEHKHKRRFLA